MRRQVLQLVALGALLAGLVLLQSRGAEFCARGLSALGGGAEPDAAQVAAALAAARTLPAMKRLDVHLEWIAQGSGLAEVGLERWLDVEWRAGTLSASQRAQLEEVVLAWPSAPLRRASAGVLLADGPMAAAATTGCRAARGVLGPESLDSLVRAATAGNAEALRWLPAFGGASLPALLERLDAGSPGASGALHGLMKAYPEERRRVLPALVERLGRGGPATARAHELLRAVTGEDLPADPAPWRDWWEEIERRIEKFTAPQ